MNWCCETVKMSVPPGNRRTLNSVLKQYVAGFEARGRSGGRPYPRSESRRGVMNYPGEVIPLELLVSESGPRAVEGGAESYGMKEGEIWWKIQAFTYG